MYKLIKELCAEKGISVSRMCDEIGISRTTMSELNSGRTRALSTDTIQKIADYLEVPVGRLFEEGRKEPVSVGDELIEILEACKERTDLRMLFKLSKDATPEDIKKTISILKALKND